MGQYYLLQTWGQGPEKTILPVTPAHGCVSSEPHDEAQQDWCQVSRLWQNLSTCPSPTLTTHFL